MSRAAIRQALEGHLATLMPAWPTKWENVTFSEPTTRTPWQSAAVLFADTRAMGMAAGSGEAWRGVFHVTIWTPAGTGPQAAEARAAALRGDLAAGIEGHFRRGLVLTSGTAAVTILQPTERTPITSDPKWYGLPVLIPFQSFFG
ncbi:phage tail terminator-like protein [Elstera cyanobacteriorum]|uniref:phage tail terminator-like protein n=1 Tax=Elstera cyanobacteriorum TaxID=2022747 RepID=UPI002357E1F6|nr:phage tail terminator-like protein [Elstera cyanobacteriorum]MCK6444416.1 DUF4128 domain-containing protein [Elstera cyanobacteriorum]